MTIGTLRPGLLQKLHPVPPRPARKLAELPAGRVGRHL